MQINKVVSKFGTRLTLLSSNGIKSVVDIEGYDDELIKYMKAIDVFLPGIELNSEPNRKILAIALSVERDIETGEVTKIVDAGFIRMID